MTDDYNLIDALGGIDRAREVMRDFYDRVFDDLLIGFLFAESDKTNLVESQLAYMSANLGDRAGTYVGPSIRDAHADLPITSGMFDRRHQILRETLQDHAIPARITSDWLTLDASLRNNVVRWGADNR